MNFLLEPLQYPFMQQALIMAIVIAVVCALLSCFLVLKGWALLGDAISHAVLPGIVLASLLNIPLAIGAFAAAVACTQASSFIERHSRLKQDAVLGIAFTSLFALGLLLYHAGSKGQHLMHILFGNILGIESVSRYQVWAIAAVVCSVFALKWRDFLLYVFDEHQARLSGLCIPCLQHSLLILLALTCVAAMQAVGVVLVVAMLIAPALTAQLLCKRFAPLLLCACISSVLTAVCGVIISYHLDAATGACIILCQSSAFIAALCFNALRQSRYRRLKQSQNDAASA